jgi:hypothetical protein
MKDIPSLDNTLTKEGFAAEAKAVGDALDKRAVGKAYLSSNTDLNTVTTSGMYRLGGSLVNAPSGSSYGQLLVIHGGGDSIAQLIFDFTMARMWVRTGAPADVGGAGTWTEWAQCYTTAKKPTASDVGAAPAGYGLGEWATVTTDFNTAFGTGWYYGNNVQNAPFYYSLVHAMKVNDERVIQIAYDVAHSGSSHYQYGAIAVRRYIVGVWDEWEYVNPPMIPTAEYRTTERWNGKAVYVKLIDCGTTVAGRKQIKNNSLYGTPIRAAGKISNSISPFIHQKDLSNAYTGYINVEGSEISVYSSVEGNTAYVTIWYTKD